MICTKQAAAMIGVKPRRFLDLSHDGRFGTPFSNSDNGRYLQWDEKAIEKYIESRRVAMRAEMAKSARINTRARQILARYK